MSTDWSKWIVTTPIPEHIRTLPATGDAEIDLGISRHIRIYGLHPWLRGHPDWPISTTNEPVLLPHELKGMTIDEAVDYLQKGKTRK